MSLAHESTLLRPGLKVGDMKIAHYDIVFTTNQLVIPSLDPNYILLDGCILSQTTYANLFSIYGSSFNTGGEGSGNFRLPDLTEGKVPFGKGLTNFTTYAAHGGEINHVLITTELAAHSHSTSGYIFVASPHNHTGGAVTGAGDSHLHSSLTDTEGDTGDTREYQFQSGTAHADAPTPGTGSTGSGNSHSHSGTLSLTAEASSMSVGGSVENNTGGSGHNNMQPYKVIGGWLVKYR